MPARYEVGQALIICETLERLGNEGLSHTRGTSGHPTHPKMEELGCIDYNTQDALLSGSASWDFLDPSHMANKQFQANNQFSEIMPMLFGYHNYDQLNLTTC